MYGRDELQAVSGKVPGAGFPDGFSGTQTNRKASGKGHCTGSFPLEV